VGTGARTGLTDADPPVATRVTYPVERSAESAKKNRMVLGVLAVVLLAGAGLALYRGWTAAGIILGVLGLFFGIAALSKMAKVAHCPYCDAEAWPIGSKVTQALLRCPECGEYSQYAGGKVRAYDPLAVAAAPKFESVVFKNGGFPNACAACGAPATRVDEVSTSKIDGSTAALSGARLAHALATGSPALLLLRRTQASINVPYCEKHRGAVQLKIDMQKRPVLVWSSYRMLRRYLAANRAKENY
jgi:hypothetical protein